MKYDYLVAEDKSCLINILDNEDTDYLKQSILAKERKIEKTIRHSSYKKGEKVYYDHSFEGFYLEPFNGIECIVEKLEWNDSYGNYIVNLRFDNGTSILCSDSNIKLNHNNYFKDSEVIFEMPYMDED